MSGEWIRRGIGILLLSLVLIGTAAAYFPASSTAAVINCPDGPGRVAVVLVAPEGWIDLRDQPASPVVRLKTAAGTVGCTVDRVWYQDGCWYLIERHRPAGQGWVPGEVLRSQPSSDIDFRQSCKPQ